MSPQSPVPPPSSASRRACFHAGLVLPTILAFVLAVFAPPSASAQGWDLELRVGAITEPIYPGSDDAYLVPIVDLQASTRRGAWSWSASLLQGLDLTWFDPQRGWLVALNVNQGDERRPDVYSVAGFERDHDDATRRLLAGSNEVSNPVNATVTLGRLTPIGIVGVSLAYLPTTLESTDDDDLAHGLVGSVLHMLVLPVTDRLEASSLLQLEFMDGTYAETWYTAPESNAHLDAFDAPAGPRAARVALQLAFAATERVSLSCVAAYTRLLGDAGASPYTTARDQTVACLQAHYRF